MNVLLLIAGLLSILLALAHSFLGERLIFRGWRELPPAIKRRQQNIIWASWHLGSFLGLGIGSSLVFLSTQNDLTSALWPVLIIWIIAFVLSALVVLYATKGKHPGWIVFLIIVVFTLLGMRV